ncbi:MAG: serine/threonine protein kinase, partial [Myxococcales bacterium]|nr:serine/threonine protein kinase [Myxococcales bacterium]
MNLVGAHVGNYVVTRELGAGGMGTVYLAEHPALGRKVAVKVLHEDNAADPETVARFFQEAKAAAEIGHENIIEVLDFGTLTVDGQPVVYLMMEFLDGVSLGKRIRRGDLTEGDVRHVLRQCCSALSASHAHGIIHRDIKPENIYLLSRASDPLFVKVLDFGIAKLTRGKVGSARTRVGTILGTPQYMSPEQCQGRGQIDGRSDVYALGVVMYEMLTGTLPFDGTLGQVLQAHLVMPPAPPSERRPGVSAELEAICLHCLEKDRGDRFANMAELAAALDDPAAHLAAWRDT